MRRGRARSVGGCEIRTVGAALRGVRSDSGIVTASPLVITLITARRGRRLGRRRLIQVSEGGIEANDIIYL